MSGDSMTANHVEHKIATFPRITGAGRIGVPCRPAIAYSRVDTGRNPSAVPSNSNFPASHLGSQLSLIAQCYRAFSSPPLGRTTRLLGQAKSSAAIATTQEGHRSPSSGPEVRTDDGAWYRYRD